MSKNRLTEKLHEEDNNAPDKSFIMGYISGRLTEWGAYESIDSKEFFYRTMGYIRDSTESEEALMRYADREVDLFIGKLSN